MIRLDIGHQSHHGLEVQKRGVTFISLYHQIVALAECRIGACLVEQTANDKGWVFARLSQYRCN